LCNATQHGEKERAANLHPKGTNGTFSFQPHDMNPFIRPLLSRISYLACEKRQQKEKPYLEKLQGWAAKLTHFDLRTLFHNSKHQPIIFSDFLSNSPGFCAQISFFLSKIS
jgi:hypothetical protein